MKIRTDIHAGADALRTCQKERDYWKAQAENMESIAKTSSKPLPWPQPVVIQPQPQILPPATGGWVGGIYYSDQSGLCG